MVLGRSKLSGFSLSKLLNMKKETKKAIPSQLGGAEIRCKVFWYIGIMLHPHRISRPMVQTEITNILLLVSVSNFAPKKLLQT